MDRIVNDKTMNYMTTMEASKKWHISSRRIALLCTQNRINGAVKKGNMWLIPNDTEKPEDARRKEIRKKENNE